MNRLRKAVFPVAGLGSRFLPVTKASPKEMLPIVDKPLIQYAVEEAASAGVTDMIFVTGRNKRAIEDHFDTAYELETELEAKGRTALLDAVRGVLPKDCRCIYIRQAAPLGLGHAVLCARPVVGDEPFAIILADELMDAAPSATAQMAAQFLKDGKAIVGVAEVPPEHTSRYGIVSTEAQAGAVARMTGIVEKPAPGTAPSTLAVMGRYLLTPAIFELLEGLQPGAGGEIQLTDGIAALLKREAVHAMRFEGTRYDCGAKLGYLQATVELGMRHPEVGAAFTEYLRARMGRL